MTQAAKTDKPAPPPGVITPSVAAELELTDQEIQRLLDNIDTFSPEELTEINNLVEEIEGRTQLQAVRDDLIEFCKYMQPDYIVGKHHRILANKLMELEADQEDRLCCNIPPRHGKSQIISTYFPAWFLGRNPTKKVMMVSHTTDLAVDFGRKVRNIIATDKYKEVFPDVSLSADSKSAGRWNTNKGGEYYACGIGSSIAGRGADLLVVDDPHSEQDVLNGNFEVFEKAYEWFTFGARTRLMPGGRVAIVQCMTGDTPVLRPDGTETPLRDIRPGDEIATYENGQLTTAKTLNWASQGLDHTYTICLASGRLLQANVRHPFLVERDGVEQWVRLKHLKPGDSLVSLKGARVPAGPKPNPANVGPANQNAVTIRKILMHRIWRWVTGASTRVKLAKQKDAAHPQKLKDYVSVATTRKAGPRVSGEAHRSRYASDISNTGMASLWKNIIGYWLNRMASALSVVNLLPKIIPAPIGVGSSALTTAMTPIGYVDSYAMTVTSPLDTPRQSVSPLLSLNTYGRILDPITEITYAGVEEVFDLQVERTENFIANGCVSHNTRWHMDDLTGRLVRDMAKKPDADQYHVIEFPAILEVNKGNGTVEKPLWPEFFDLKALRQTKASMPLFQWNAQFQQNPTSEEGSLIKREWWRRWKKDDPPDCEYVIMTLDAAAETHNRADFTAITTWGVFFNEEASEYHIVLLNSVKERYEFPELKRKAIEDYRYWEPDSFVVEKKSAGAALYQELRRMGMPVSEYTPHRGSGDKMARLNSVTDIVASGLCWVPETTWADELVEEIAAFPFGSNDDLVDATVMALMRFRQGGFIRLPSDEPEEIQWFKSRRGRGYY